MIEEVICGCDAVKEFSNRIGMEGISFHFLQGGNTQNTDEIGR
jgi:hypothetical protein